MPAALGAPPAAPAPAAAAGVAGKVADRTEMVGGPTAARDAIARSRAALLFPCLALLCGHPLFAADKSGVSPTTISLPKGPGSVEGLGESFQPTLNTGTEQNERTAEAAWI